MSLLGIDWDFSRLNGLIESRGDVVILETAVACPCRNGDLYSATIEIEGKPGNQRNLSCPQCNGDGFRYRNARKVKGLITSLDPGKNRTLFEAGYAVLGDAVFSPDIDAGIITDFDKITICAPQPVNEGQVIRRGSHTIEENATFDTDLANNEDRLWYRPACSIWCEDENGVVYSQGSDFTFDAKKIVWEGNTPDLNTLYTVKYSAYLEWVAYETPFARIDRNRSLGQRVLIRKKHVTFTTDSPLDSPAHRQEEEIDFTTRTKI